MLVRRCDNKCGKESETPFPFAVNLTGYVSRPGAAIDLQRGPTAAFNFEACSVECFGALIRNMGAEVERRVLAGG